MSSADVKELKHLLSGDTGIEEGHILLCEIDGEGFHRTFTGIHGDKMIMVGSGGV